MAKKTNFPLFKKVLKSGETRGQDLELVWLHGWGQDHSSFERLAGLFKHGAVNILYDLPGFGNSPMLEPGAGTGRYAEVLIKELEKTNPSRRIIIGHSFGCRVALRIAVRVPGLADGLVLIAAAGLPRKRGAGWKLKSLAIKALGKAAHLSDETFKTSLKPKFRNRFGSRDYKAAGALRETFVATVTENLTETASAIKTPAVLIYGQDDQETPVEVGKRFEKLLEGSHLTVLSGFGHLSILTSGVYQCQHIINKFLRGLGAE